MKILIFSDVHWSTYSSIIRKRSNKYSQRLELLLDGMNWVNQTALEKKCEAMICCGDFFDKAQMSDEEITALKDIQWNSLPCYFLCGNHESSVSDLRYNALKALETENHYIISTPTELALNDKDNTKLCFLPYITESDKKPLEEYFAKNDRKRVLLSHNELLGINYGGFESKTGFAIQELEDSFSLVLNGHLHNTEWVSKKILNVGSFSAHNFTNDSVRYNYGIWILDTDTLQAEFIENPFGLNFYKLELENKIKLKRLATIKNNAVLSIKCTNDLVEDVNKFLADNKNKIIEHKLVIAKQDLEILAGEVTELRGEDHIQRLISFCHEKLNNTEVLDQELAEICK